MATTRIRAGSEAPPAVVWRLAVAAYDNSVRHVGAAESLHAAGYYGEASSLAIAAREELGKALAALLVAIGRAPGVKLDEVLSSHPSKQALGMIARALGCVSVDFDAVIAAINEAGERLPTPKVISQLMAQIEAAITFDEARFDSIGRDIELAMAGNDEARRQAGLYVDVVRTAGEWTIKSPSDITETESAEQLAKVQTLQEFLRKVEDSVGGAFGEDQGNPADSPEFLDGLRLLASFVPANAQPDSHV
jgi:AbiV family abortive infection protein